jgi:hypothetical protein
MFVVVNNHVFISDVGNWFFSVKNEERFQSFAIGCNEFFAIAFRAHPLLEFLDLGYSFG